MAQIHDYTKRVLGDEFLLDAPLEGLTGEMTGQGDVQPGDSILICIRCQVVEVERYADPPDMWRAKVSLLGPSSIEELPEPMILQLFKQVTTQLGGAIQHSELYQQLQRLLASDRLTQLANRQRFEEYLTQEWQRMIREQKPLSLILCKLDPFSLQSLTDEDDLRKIATEIRESARRSSDLVARYREDTFAILLPNTPLPGASHVAERIRSRITGLQEANPSLLSAPVTLSLGVASYVPSRDSSYELLLRSAERALQEALDQGGNTVDIATPQTSELDSEASDC